MDKIRLLPVEEVEYPIDDYKRMRRTDGNVKIYLYISKEITVKFDEVLEQAAAYGTGSGNDNNFRISDALINKGEIIPYIALHIKNPYIIAMSDVRQVKANYEKKTEEILQLHRTGAGGIRISLKLTNRFDTLLQTIFQDLNSNADHLSILALGGYGRKELNFFSDADILFLIAGDEHRQTATPAVQEFLHRLLDVGIDVGHSYRTIDECITLSTEHIESWMSLIEARLICGNKITFRKFIKKISEKIKQENRLTFVSKISEMLQLRHTKYGDSSKLLEPNIKNSAGGLRDIHTVLWLLRGTGTVSVSSRLGAKETAILNILKTSAIKNLFSPLFLKEAQSAFDTLLRIRNEMHIQSKSLHDTLEFSFQIRVASHLRYRGRSKRTNVEHFMQDYYRASRTISILCSRIIEWANDRWSARPIEIKTKKIDKYFSIRGRRIQPQKLGASITNELVLRGLLIRSERNAEFSFKFEDAIHRQLPYFKPLRSQTETDLFRILLDRPKGVGNSFRKMNELGLLERWIPEWKPMVSFFQHNQYHYYTADEHTLIVLIHAEALEDSNSTFGTVFRSLPRRDTIYLSCLMHDIAKPFHISKHEIKGVPIAKRVLKRLMYDDLSRDISFLIRYHLLMEQVAFRRNLNDPQTIKDFAATFDRVELLDYLYILTYADLSAVNKNVWTDWKESLINELYRKTRSALEQNFSSKQIQENPAEEKAEELVVAIRDLASEFSIEGVERHLRMLSGTSYLTAFKPEDIADHLKIISRRENASALFKQYDSYTEIVFISNDAPGVLSKFCGVLTANDVSILDAQVFTRQDGIVIDSFRVTEFISNRSLPEERFDLIAHDLEEVMEGRADILHLMDRHKMKWKRRIQRMNPDARCDVEFEDHPRYTIVDVYAPDTHGFLYRITDTISGLDLNITFAKIATRADGIVDSFYILDSNGKKLNDPVQLEILKKEILKTIQSLSESELVTSITNS